MSFSDFKEVESVVKLLQRGLERGRLAHAYLFTGDDLDLLVGVAETLAKTLNCLQPVMGSGELPIDNCEACVNCKRVRELNHPDVHWVRPESKSRVIRIDQMRELMRVVHLKPTEAEYKVNIIVAADRMNVQSANAFLKTLEEPPPKSIIILLCSDPNRLLDTILSRCQRLNFAGGGGLRLTDGERSWLAEFSSLAAQQQGSLLGRYHLFASVMGRLETRRKELETELAKRSPLAVHEDVEDHLRKKWEEELKASIEAEYRRERGDMLQKIQWWARDIWMQTMGSATELMALQDLSASTQVVAGRIKPDAALKNMEHIERLLALLDKTNVQEALALEVGMLKLEL